MKVGVIGHGVVGKAASNTFQKKYKVIYDKFQDLDEFDRLSNRSFVFIMVPTPFDCKKKLVDISAIEESLNRLEKIDYNGNSPITH